VLPENDIILDKDDIVGIIRIILFQVHKNLELNPSLMLKALFIPDQFHSNKFFRFMIKTLESLPKAAFTKELNDLKLIPYMVLKYYFVISSFIVVAEVIGLLRRTFDFFCPYPQIINLLIVENLPLFMVGQLIHEEL
jgi:hypothetical protein